MTEVAVDTMKWIKQGLVYCPDGSIDWAQHYAIPPTPLLVGSDRLRMFLSFCDANTVGRAGYVDVDPANPMRILAISKKPILDVGKPGRFDENGVLPTCVLPVGETLYMYYVGYQLGQKVRYYQFAGLAISTDGGETFERAQEVPVIDRSNGEAVNRTSAYVMLENRKFKMWYVGGSEWTVGNGKSLPVYNMRYIESDDGIHWPTNGTVCLDYKNDDEHALGRPWIVKEDGTYKMFFSSRTYSKSYRLGYAESPDGVNWRRKDEAVGIDVSEEGWDSEMIAYASIFKWKEQTYMFYNGNNCGSTGFGYAILKR
jgi:predicted GH43/DUF377 family glycosyl hydrolase